MTLQSKHQLAGTAPVHKARVALHKAAPVASRYEHLGYVGVALADVAHLGELALWSLALWLLLTGIPQAFRDFDPCKECEL